MPHRVLSGRVSGRDAFVFQGTVKCTHCGRVRAATVREAKPIEVPIIVSEEGDSERGSIELGPDELVRVGDRLEYEGHRIEVTSIQAGDRRVPASKARNIGTLWAKRMDRILVKVSLNKGSRTITREFAAAPDEEFEVGDILDLGRERVLIHRIRVGDATLRRGMARAEDIVRVYGKFVRERTSR